MKILKINDEVAKIETASNEILITNEQSALDLIATVKYETKCSNIILAKEQIIEEFFDLSTKIAGNVLQKFINYHAKLAIIGDFSNYKSKSLHDFIFECNKGKDIFFLNSEEEALIKLSDN